MRLMVVVCLSVVFAAHVKVSIFLIAMIGQGRSRYVEEVWAYDDHTGLRLRLRG